MRRMVPAVMKAVADWALFRARLEAERVEIEDARVAGAEARAIVELDQDMQGRLSRMDAMERQAMAEANEQRRILRLKQIGAALARMDAGEYGFCMDCGEEIAPARLDAEPCVLKCGDCVRS